MGIAEDFAQGKIACEIEGCMRIATTAVQDLGRLYGQGPLPIEVVPVGERHFLCDLHKRESYSFRREGSQWVRV